MKVKYSVPGEVVVRQGTTAESVYFIRPGEGYVFQRGEDGGGWRLWKNIQRFCLFLYMFDVGMLFLCEGLRFLSRFKDAQRWVLVAIKAGLILKSFDYVHKIFSL